MEYYEISAKITDKNGNVLTDGDVEYFIVDNDGNKLPISDGTILRPNDYQIVVKYTDDTKGVLEYSEPITITTFNLSKHEEAFIRRIGRSRHCSLQQTRWSRWT